MKKAMIPQFAGPAWKPAKAPKRRSPSPKARRSPSPKRRSPSPKARRSPSPKARRSPSPKARRSPSPKQQIIYEQLLKRAHPHLNMSLSESAVKALEKFRKVLSKTVFNPGSSLLAGSKLYETMGIFPNQVEYPLVEILDLTGHSVRDSKRNQITAEDLERIAQGDDEFLIIFPFSAKARKAFDIDERKTRILQMIAEGIFY